MGFARFRTRGRNHPSGAAALVPKAQTKKIAQDSGGWLHGQAGRSCVYKENGKRALHGVIGGPGKYDHRAERKFFCVLLTAPRGGKAREKKLRCARNNGRVARKHPPPKAKSPQTLRNHHQKAQKTPQKTQKHQKKRAYARKISPDAKTKSQFPWPRRGHQTGEIPALRPGSKMAGHKGQNDCFCDITKSKPGFLE